jgi:hypothetical protein
MIVAVQERRKQRKGQRSEMYSIGAPSKETRELDRIAVRQPAQIIFHPAQDGCQGGLCESDGKRPALLPTIRPSLHAEGVNLVVLRADINQPIRHGGRGAHIAACGVSPQLVPGLGVQRNFICPRLFEIETSFKPSVRPRMHGAS